MGVTTTPIEAMPGAAARRPNQGIILAHSFTCRWAVWKECVVFECHFQKYFLSLPILTRYWNWQHIKLSQAGKDMHGARRSSLTALVSMLSQKFDSSHSTAFILVELSTLTFMSASVASSLFPLMTVP